MVTEFDQVTNQPANTSPKSDFRYGEATIPSKNDPNVKVHARWEELVRELKKGKVPSGNVFDGVKHPVVEPLSEETLKEIHDEDVDTSTVLNTIYNDKGEKVSEITYTSIKDTEGKSFTRTAIGKGVRISLESQGGSLKHLSKRDRKAYNKIHTGVLFELG